MALAVLIFGLGIVELLASRLIMVIALQLPRLDEPPRAERVAAITTALRQSYPQARVAIRALAVYRASRSGSGASLGREW